MFSPSPHNGSTKRSFVLWRSSELQLLWAFAGTLHKHRGLPSESSIVVGLGMTDNTQLRRSKPNYVLYAVVKFPLFCHFLAIFNSMEHSPGKISFTDSGNSSQHLSGTHKSRKMKKFKWLLCCDQTISSAKYFKYTSAWGCVSR